MGNSLGRAPVEGSETEVWTLWTGRKPWEIDWGEFPWEGAGRSGDIMNGKETVLRWRQPDGSDDIMNGKEKVGNSLGRAPLGGSQTEATIS